MTKRGGGGQRWREDTAELSGTEVRARVEARKRDRQRKRERV